MTATQEQLAKLGALVGITPETHPYIWQHTTALDPIEDDWHSLWYLLKGDIKYRLAPYAPALDTPAGDDVFGMPFMRWCHKEDLHPDVGQHYDGWGAFILRGKRYTGTGTAATLALLRACQSAGVPEICEIFGKGE